MRTSTGRHRREEGHAPKGEEEEGAEDPTRREGPEDGREDLEDQAWAASGLQAQGEDGGKDGQPRQEAGASISQYRQEGVAPQPHLRPQVGAVDHHEGATQGQGEDHLPQRRHGHRRGDVLGAELEDEPMEPFLRTGKGHRPDDQQKEGEEEEGG